jgi:phosphate transport system substrate-binding protein
MPGFSKSGRAAPVVKVGGTGSALAAISLLAEEYARSVGGASIQVLPSLGTTGGIRALQAGVIQLALAARPLKEAERAAGLSSHEYARTPLVFATHPDVGLSGVTYGEVIRIYSGEKTSWPVGTPVRLIRRPPTEADWETLSSLSPAMANAVGLAIKRPGLVTAASDQDNADALERIQGAFGLVALGQILSERRNITALDLDGVNASITTLQNGRWPMVRTLHLVTSLDQTSETRDFISFIEMKGAAILAEHGHLPTLGGR